MKNFIIIGFVLSMALLKACEFNLPYNAGFDAEFNENSKGLTAVHVNNKVNTVFLEGNIDVAAGEIVISLIDPSGTTVFSRTLTAPSSISIHERYGAMTGLWKLNYESIDGTGKLNLHMGY